MSTYSGVAALPARTVPTLPDDRFTLLGDVTSFEVRGSTLILDAGGPRLAVTVLADDVLRVRLAPTGDFRAAGHGADADQTPFSYALDADRDWPRDTLSVRDLGDEIRVETPALRVRVAKSPLRLHVETPDGRMILSDTAGAGFAEVEDAEAPGGRRTETRCWKALVPDARFFGLGDKTFELDRRGRKLTFWNSDTFAYAPEQDPIYKSIPFALTLAPSAAPGGSGDAWTGGGLFLDNTYRAEMDLGVDTEAGADGDWWFGAHDGELRYYVFAPGAGSDALKHPLRRYCDLTGHKPMPARWSLGYHQSRWNYHDAGYARFVAHEFRRRGIPLDCIHLDIGHMDGYRVFTWNQDAFPDPVAMNDDLRALGVRSVVIVDPGVKVDDGYYAYREGASRELFCETPDGSFFTDTVWPGDVHWPDFSKPEARSWWGEQHRRYLDAGVTGFWNDMNEPAILGGRDFPDDVRFAYADRGTGSTDHREAHNVYGLLMARATFDSLTADVRPDERPFLLTRACFSGSQRYAAAWTGDNVSSWEHLLLSIQICQSLSASGMAFCGPDIGGFAGQATPELFARWMQVGVLYPFMRTHYSHEETSEQEPWSFGPEAEAISQGGHRAALPPHADRLLGVRRLHGHRRAAHEAALPRAPRRPRDAPRLRRPVVPRPQPDGGAGRDRGRHVALRLLPRRHVDRLLDRRGRRRRPAPGRGRAARSPAALDPRRARRGAGPGDAAHRRVRARDAHAAPGTGRRRLALHLRRRHQLRLPGRRPPVPDRHADGRLGDAFARRHARPRVPPLRVPAARRHRHGCPGRRRRPAGARRRRFRDSR